MTVCCVTKENRDVSHSVLQSLKQLGEGGNRERIQRLSALEQGEKYPIISARRTTTKFGAAVVVYLKDCKVYLPARFSALTDEGLKFLNSGQVIMIYRGRVNSMDVVDFETSS